MSFDFHSGDYAARWPELTAAIRSSCPVAWTDEYDGFWVVTGYEETSALAVVAVTAAVSLIIDGQVHWWLPMILLARTCGPISLLPISSQRLIT